MTKDEREALEAATAMISPSAQLSSAAPMQQSPLPAKMVTVSPTGPNVKFTNKSKEDREAVAAKPYMTKDEREAAAVKMVTVSPTGPNVKFSNKSKEDLEASTAYKSYAYSNTTPVRTNASQTVYTSTPTGITTSPVVSGSKNAREAAEAAAAGKGTDWIGLAIRVSGIYTLIKNLI